ncbi:MAG TPA: nuclear transport factor 2 family protein [Pseudoxanthomonas sp.]|nr:nuclear transport factor 2 family protein [Pseudoxanthomonas sp.]
MTRAIRTVLIAGMGLLSATALAAEDPARCEVWQRELSFARSVAEHDPVAFAAHLAPNAAFGVNNTPILGREAVVREWQGLIDGTALVLEWYPAVVTVGGDGRTAYSSGPALYQDPKTGIYRHGRYGSVWQRGEDGVWRLIFDDGIRPVPADAAAVQAFRDGSGKPCTSN